MKKGFKLEDSKGRKLRWDCHTLIQIAKSLKGQPPYAMFMPVDGGDSNLWNTAEFSEPAYSRLLSALEQQADDFVFSEMLELEDAMGPPYQKTWVLVNVSNLISSLESKIPELRQYDPRNQFSGSAHYETELRNLKRRHLEVLPEVIDLYVYFGTEAVLTKLQKKIPSRSESPLIELCSRSGTEWDQITIQFLNAQWDSRLRIYVTTSMRFIVKGKPVEVDALSLPQFTRENRRPLKANSAYFLLLWLASKGGAIPRKDVFDPAQAAQEGDLESAKRYANLQKQKESLAKALKEITGLDGDPFRPYRRLSPEIRSKMTLILLDEDGETIQIRPGKS